MKNLSYMQQAIIEAKKAFESGEIPVGCVIVKDRKIISYAHNTTESEKDFTCHAELNAIKKAVKRICNKYLDDCEMYVTLEPCAMCAGAILNSRLKRLYIGVEEPKTGCCGSVINLFAQSKTEVYIGFEEDECRELLKKFFENKR